MTTPKEYLEELQWDGLHRLAKWAGRYLDASEGHEFAAAWLVAAVARVFEPGCRVGGLLVLQAPQGAGKSSALRALAGPFGCGELPADLQSRDAVLSVMDSWIVELPELERLRASEVAQVWTFVSRRIDQVRAPFASQAQAFPRSCVFAASSNGSSWLRDPGNCRCWVVTCGKIDTAAILHDRDQLWAEAVVAYRAGMPWWVVLAGPPWWVGDAAR